MDDIIISGASEDVEAVVGVVIRTLHQLGLKVSREKLRFLPNHRPQLVMNAHVNRAPSLPKTRRSGAKGIVWNELRSGVHAATPSQNESNQASLLGKLRYAANFNSQRASQLQEKLSKKASQ